MAQIKTVLTDLENNCAKSDGNSPGQYRIDVAAIEYGGIRHHVESYLQKIYVFEDIEKFGVTGWLELRDADNLISGFYNDHTIVGQELLFLKFRTEGSHLPVDFTKHPLHIHKIENVQSTGGVGVQKYRIHFCSPELLNNDRIRISQAFEGTCDEIVTEILTKHLKTMKSVWVEPTQNIFKVIIPNMHPFDAINFILKKSKSKDFKGMSNYNFYETTKGYRYKSLYVGSAAFLGSDGGSAPTFDQNTDWQIKYTYSPTKQSGTYLTEMLSAKSFRYLRLGDTLSAIQNGLFASKSIEHDALHKSYKVKAATYIASDKDKENPDISELVSVKERIIKRPHILPGHAYVPTGDKLNQTGQMPFEDSTTFTQFPDSRIFFHSTGTKHLYDFVNDDGTVFTKDSGIDPLIRNQKEMQQQHDRYLQLQIISHGVSGLQVGDSFTLEVPLIGPGGSQGMGTKDPRMSNFGYYIIKLVHHIELHESNPYYECIIDMAPMAPGKRALPKRNNNAVLDGKDTASGSVGSFRGKRERQHEPD